MSSACVFTPIYCIDGFLLRFHYPGFDGRDKCHSPICTNLSREGGVLMKGWTVITFLIVFSLLPSPQPYFSQIRTVARICSHIMIGHCVMNHEEANHKSRYWWPISHFLQCRSFVNNNFSSQFKVNSKHTLSKLWAHSENTHTHPRP